MEAKFTDTPDTSYWTAYDYRMFERDAQAMRRAHVYATVIRLWQRIMQRVPRQAPRAHQQQRYEFGRGL